MLYAASETEQLKNKIALIGNIFIGQTSSP